MRAILDTNVLISYLLSPPGERRVVHEVVDAAVEGRFTLLVPAVLVEELARKVAGKKYLAQRITAEDAAELIRILASVAETIPAITAPIPRATRDRKDDYLLAYALVGRADCLVTGHADLLVLGEVEGVQIVTPADFLALLP